MKSKMKYRTLRTWTDKVKCTGNAGVKDELYTQMFDAWH